MKNLWANKSSKNTKIAIALLAVVAVFVGFVIANPVLASAATATLSNIQSTLIDTLSSVYTIFLGIVTVIAVVIVAWCFLVKMFSKNPRSIEEANQWMKRVMICWICFMLINLIVSFGMDIVGSSNANTAKPWTVGTTTTP
jgi:NADH:ubiquinone oxidoreductase subunit 5 (subunit L)/multisubunit Na+/H+ antiporter MnhA subunit